MAKKEFELSVRKVKKIEDIHTELFNLIGGSRLNLQNAEEELDKMGKLFKKDFIRAYKKSKKVI